LLKFAISTRPCSGLGKCHKSYAQVGIGLGSEKEPDVTVPIFEHNILSKKLSTFSFDVDTAL
jgi:hypothetical protein